jgi:hypothetical protein
LLKRRNGAGESDQVAAFAAYLEPFNDRVYGRHAPSVSLENGAAQKSDGYDHGSYAITTATKLRSHGHGSSCRRGKTRHGSAAPAPKHAAMYRRNNNQGYAPPSET